MSTRKCAKCGALCISEEPDVASVALCPTCEEEWVAEVSDPLEWEDSFE